MAERRDLAAGASFLRTVLRWNRRDNASRRLLAKTLNDLERNEEAIQVWRDLDKETNGDEEALRNIIGLSLTARRPADAVAALRRLLEIEDDPESIRGIEVTIRQIEQASEASR